MMSFSLYIFGATYMIRGKLDPVIGQYMVNLLAALPMLTASKYHEI